MGETGYGSSPQISMDLTQYCEGNQGRVVCTATTTMHNSREESLPNGNNRLTLQEQSWVPEAGKGTQLVLISAARADTQEVTTIIEEHKLFFNPCIIVLMFTCES